LCRNRWVFDGNASILARTVSIVLGTTGQRLSPTVSPSLDGVLW
jgi:hypothetical protein